jgi:MYXO-CTERM domain-containing protein
LSDVRSVRLCALGLPLVAAALLPPATARAGDGTHPRTPVQWPADTPCMTVVDRSKSSLLHFPYEIPYEDTELTPDELQTSRRHQFLALCRNYSPQEPLPTWISLKDVADWNEWLAMLGFDPFEPEPDEVMDTHPIYGPCTHRITPDDARRPITFAEAAKGVDWDTSGLPAGTYVVQVVDGPDPAAVEPAVALMNTEDYMNPDDTLELHGCVRAMPGSTMTGYWSLTGPEGLEWIPFAENVPIEGESLVLPYTPTEEARGETIALRVDVTDPMQRTFSAYPRQLLVVLKNAVPGDTEGCNESGNFIGNPNCEGDDSGSTSEGGDSSGGAPTSSTSQASEGATSEGSSVTGDSASTAPMEGPASGRGCGCRSGEAGGAWAWAGLALLGLARRRRPRR